MQNKLYELAKKNRVHTNKYVYYLDLYEQFIGQSFDPCRDELNLLEMGLGRFRIEDIGIDHHPLQLWRLYLPKSRIYGIDPGPCPHASLNSVEAITVWKGRQEDTKLLDGVIAEAGGTLDIVVDDASHAMQEQQTSLCHLFPKLSPGGLYFIEDLHTCYQVPCRPAGRGYPMQIKSAEEVRTSEVLLFLAELALAKGAIQRDPATLSEVKAKHSRAASALSDEQIEMFAADVEYVTLCASFAVVKKADRPLEQKWCNRAYPSGKIPPPWDGEKYGPMHKGNERFAGAPKEDVGEPGVTVHHIVQDFHVIYD